MDNELVSRNLVTGLSLGSLITAVDAEDVQDIIYARFTVLLSLTSKKC